MANDIRKKAQYIGVSATTDNRFEMIIQMDEESYRSLIYHLANSAENHEYFSQIEDAVNLRQSLQDCWQTARKQYEIMNEED